jgi:hypothetical protein
MNNAALTLLSILILVVILGLGALVGTCIDSEDDD